MMERQGVPEFTRERYERLRVLVKSCVRELDRIGVEGRRKKTCATRLVEQVA
ncbi:hypothetical protein E2C01_027908 [Portunus trituberculatus]|uniref:Uncharacterized protein n=1 Tax=Portunus trituberculatus TaxID=210409 RepID=A0A5B7EMT8_PORTR|nr:hypothetical protein [Portunus trituberculatus]